MLTWVANGKYTVLDFLDAQHRMSGTGTFGKLTVQRRVPGTSGQTRIDVRRSGVSILTAPIVILASAGPNAGPIITTLALASFSANDLMTAHILEVDVGEPEDLTVDLLFSLS